MCGGRVFPFSSSAVTYIVRTGNSSTSESRLLIFSLGSPLLSPFLWHYGVHVAPIHMHYENTSLRPSCNVPIKTYTTQSLLKTWTVLAPRKFLRIIRIKFAAYCRAQMLTISPSYEMLYTDPGMNGEKCPHPLHCLSLCVYVC